MGLARGGGSPSRLRLPRPSRMVLPPTHHLADFESIKELADTRQYWGG